MSNFMHLKAIASKAIIDAAGGGTMGADGYDEQGGYFGQALKTAYRCELTLCECSARNRCLRFELKTRTVYVTVPSACQEW